MQFFLEREWNKERASAAVLAWLQCVGGSVRLWVFAARMAAQSSTEDVLMESAAGTPTELPSLVMKKKLLRPRLKAHRLSHDDGPKQCLTHGYISDGSQDSGVGVIKETTDFDEDGIPAIDQGSPPGSMSSEKGQTKKDAAHPQSIHPLPGLERPQQG